MELIGGLNRLFRKVTGAKINGLGWGDPTEFSLRRKVLYWRAYRRAVPRIKRFTYSGPAKKVAALRSGGIEVHERDIDPDALEEFRSRCDYSSHYLGTPDDRGFFGKAYREKSLEHFLSTQLLGLRKEDILIDIASAASNYPDNVRTIVGCTVFRQDIIWEEGMHADKIGGDAGRMPIPDNFATALSLHCSLEHFEGDADIRFMQEARRVLVPRGRLCILPLYIEHEHMIATQPELWKSDIPLDPGAQWYFPPSEQWNNRFGRFYSPKAFRERIMSHLDPFEWEFIWFRNRHELYPELWCDFALVGRLP